MSAYAPTAATTLHRIPSRGTYDRATVHAILDEALVAHVGFVFDDRPCVIPTIFARDGERLLVHGAAASRMLNTLGGGVPVAVTVTLVDGLVFARSAFHHSMNYRSVVVFGVAREVEGDAKRDALRCIVDKIGPDRWSQARPPSDKELRATCVLEVKLEEVSAKVRSGPALDDPEDMSLAIWAGTVPVALRPGPPEPDEHSRGIPSPAPSIRMAR